MTLAEMYPESAATKSMMVIAEDIIRKSANQEMLKYPHPLNDDAMDMIAKGVPLVGESTLEYRRVRNPVNDCWSLKTCAGMGAVAYSKMVRGIHTIIHGPTSCAYMMSCRSDLWTGFRICTGMAVWSVRMFPAHALTNPRLCSVGWRSFAT